MYVSLTIFYPLKLLRSGSFRSNDSRIGKSYLKTKWDDPFVGFLLIYKLLSLSLYLTTTSSFFINNVGVLVHVVVSIFENIEKSTNFDLY